MYRLCNAAVLLHHFEIHFLFVVLKSCFMRAKVNDCSTLNFILQINFKLQLYYTKNSVFKIYILFIFI